MTLFKDNDHWIIDIKYPQKTQRKIVQITIHDFWEEDDDYLCQIDYIGSDIWSYVRKSSPDKIDGKYKFKLIEKIDLYEDIPSMERIFAGEFDI